MKKYIAVLLPFFALFTGCNNPVQTDLPQQEPELAKPELGTVVISLAESPERTLLPDLPEFARYAVYFYKGESTEQSAKSDMEVTSLPYTAYLEPGPWVIAVYAYTYIEGVDGLSDGYYLAATGGVSAEITADTATLVTVNLDSRTESDRYYNPGVFEYDIDVSGNGIYGATLKILYMDGTECVSRDLMLSASGSKILYPGRYILQIQIASGRIRSRTELVHIYGGHTTRASGDAYNFSAEEGVFYNLAELSEYLAAVPNNTVDTPYTVKLKLNLQSLSLQRTGNNGYVSVLGALGDTLANNKYVNLDLGNATGAFETCTGDPGNPAFYASASGLATIVSVALPEGLDFIPPYTFAQCDGLKSIDNLPVSVTTIGANAFSDCSSLTMVDLSEHTALTSIGNYAFFGCASLESIKLPASLQTIGASAFQQCTSLPSIDLSACNALKTIGAYAFYYCHSLQTVNLSGSPYLSSIGNSAFMKCSQLQELDLSGTDVPPVLERQDSRDPILHFSGIYTFVIYVPAGSVEAYKSADVWKEKDAVSELTYADRIQAKKF